MIESKGTSERTMKELVVEIENIRTEVQELKTVTGLEKELRMKNTSDQPALRYLPEGEYTGAEEKPEETHEQPQKKKKQSWEEYRRKEEAFGKDTAEKRGKSRNEDLRHPSTVRSGNRTTRQEKRFCGLLT